MGIKDEILRLQKMIVSLNNEIKELKKDSHPPVFKRSTYEELNDRLSKLEAFFDNIYEITTIIDEENNNDRLAN